VQNNSTWAPLPPSRATWPPESFRIRPTLLTALGAVGIVFVSVGAYVLYDLSIGAIDPRHPQDIPATQVLVSQAVAYVPLAIYLLAVVPRLARLPLAALGFRMPTLRDLGIAAIGTVVMWTVVIGTSALVETLTHKHDTEAAIALLRSIRTPAEKAAFVAIAVAFAPFVEELAFRVFAFNALWRWMRFPAAAVASGVLFGLVHALGAAPSQLLTVALPLALAGIVLATIYAVTRCFWANVLTHAAFNSITVVAYFVFGVKT
jgi:membrane protease YdiL (CAAX protease family)